MARKSFSKFQQSEIVGSQDGKCKICSTRFSKDVHPQFDHVNGDNSDNSTKNGQAICSNCHDAKSRKESQKRSVSQKDVGFVKRCPLCNHKTRWKDYDLKNEGLTEEDWKKIGKSEYMAANQLFVCAGCKSTLKVLRLDPKVGEKKLTGKKVDDVMEYCPNCGVKYDPKIKSNIYVKCDKCKKVFGVWIKEYKKRSRWA